MLLPTTDFKVERPLSEILILAVSPNSKSFSKLEREPIKIPLGINVYTIPSNPSGIPS